MNKKRIVKTSFQDIPSHPDFIKMEEELLGHWYKDGIVEKYLHKNDKSRKKFTFLDGPITANNPMGVHHGRGRTYKDLWQRYHCMLGERERFQNGFDCQGLWVEVEVEKELGFKNKKDILAYGVEKFVKNCKERVLKFSAIQTEQSKRLGMFADWDKSYFTMSDENNYAIWHFLKVCHERGWIYKGHDSVPWCPRCETAISQHEMLTEDYKEVTHESIIMEFPIIEGSDLLKRSDPSALLVWTTTPWTLPANIAVAVDQKLKYALVRGYTGDLYWVAEEAVERIFERSITSTTSTTGSTSKNYNVIKTVKGKELVGLKYRGPFDDLPAVQEVAEKYPDKFHTVVATDPFIMPIETSEGTGLVHTAVSAGTEDFKLGKKYGLPMIPVIEDNADYMPGLGEFSGKNAKKNPRVILDYLEEKDKAGENWVFEIFPYTHRYPACWRCKTELVWKVTDEWYVAMDRPSKARSAEHGARSRSLRATSYEPRATLRQAMVEVAKKIHWIPEFGLERELDWLKNMHDWLISKKNRFWGLALPIWECDKCGYFDVIGGKNELREKSVKGWDKFDGHSPHKPWIDEVKITCQKCRAAVSRIEPVGNPWLDAGIVPFSTLPPEWFPADFVTESFPGQFKNWFYSLIVMSTVLRKEIPMKTLLGYESVVGEDGRPMHKSWGNMVEFNEGAGKIGVDVMRWMYAKAAPTMVLQFGYKLADEIRRRFLLILWNSYRFFVSQANADGWKPSSSVIARSPSADGRRGNLTSKSDRHGHVRRGLAMTNILDEWILIRLDQTVQAVTTALDAFQSAPATEAIEKFVEDFSTWYIRRSRDRVGPSSAKATDGRLASDKENAYRTMYDVLVTLSKLLAPFMPYLSDVMYTNLTGEASVHLSAWPAEGTRAKGQGLRERQLLDAMELTRKIASEGHALRKSEKINVRQPLSSVEVSGNDVQLPQELKLLLCQELNVKNVILKGTTGELSIRLDTNLTPELRSEGWARDLIRTIQGLRKEAGTQLTENVHVGLPDWPREFEDQIKRATLATTIEKSETPRVDRV